MDHNRRDPRDNVYRGQRTPMKHSASSDGGDTNANTGRGYQGYGGGGGGSHLGRGHHGSLSNRVPSLTSPAGGSSAGVGGAAFGHTTNNTGGDPGSGGRDSSRFAAQTQSHNYGSHRRENSYRGRNNAAGGAGNVSSWDNNQGPTTSSSSSSAMQTPHGKEHHPRGREKEREMMSIYGRGGDNVADALPSSSGGGSEAPMSSSTGRYSNPCRLKGHDHDWRDCPVNYRNKNKSHRGSLSGGGGGFGGMGKYGSGGGASKEEVMPAWASSVGGGSHYGPASEAGSGGVGGSSIGSDRHHHDRLNEGRGYSNIKDKSDLSLGPRSKSFNEHNNSKDGHAPVRSSFNSSHSRGYSDIPSGDREGDATFSPNTGDRKWSKYGRAGSHDRSNKPRPSPIVSTGERGYSSLSYTPTLSTGGSRMGKRHVEVDPKIPEPPFHRSYSGDVRDTPHRGGGDTPFSQRRSSVQQQQQQQQHASIDNRGSFDNEQRGRDGLPSSPRHLRDGIPSIRYGRDGPVSPRKDNAYGGNTTKHDHQPTDVSQAPESPAKPPPAKEEEALPSLTCAALGVDEKVRKAEDIVVRMNKLMNNDSAPVNDSGEVGVTPLPSKNEILKCMSVIDAKIKSKDDDVVSMKEEVKVIEEKERLEVERKAREEEERRQKLKDDVITRRNEREAEIEAKRAEHSKLFDSQKLSIDQKRQSEIILYENDFKRELKSKVNVIKMEISSVHGQVEEAERKIQELDAPSFPLDMGLGHGLLPEDESDFLPTMDAPGKMSQLIGSILEQNQKTSAQSHLESMAAIPYFPQSAEKENKSGNPVVKPDSEVSNEEWSNRARKVAGLHDALYVDPMDVPMFSENNQSFLKLAPYVKEGIRIKQKKLKSRWEDLAEQYLVRQQIYNEETGVNTETSERGGFFSLTGRINDQGEEIVHSVRGNNPYRRPRRGVNPGDVIRSEYEQEQIIAEIAAKEAMEKRIKEGGCALPHQVGMVEKVRDCRLVAVFTLACLSKLLSTLSIANDSLSDLQQLFATFTNGFLGNRVYDFVEDEEERKHVNVWSDMEKCIFLDRFLHHPKDFRKIASFLKNKTTKDCIQFYYDSKKTIPYKHALKEFLQRKKRQGSVVSWDATIQAALSVGALIRPGDSPEKPLTFILPSNDYTYHTNAFHPMRLEVFDSLEPDEIHGKYMDDVKKDRLKRSNWFILDASSRKYIKPNKDDKDHHSSAKLKAGAQPDDDEEDEEPHINEKSVPASKKVKTDNEGKKPVKAQKWTANEKKLFLEAVEKFGESLFEHSVLITRSSCGTNLLDLQYRFTGHNWARVAEAVGTRTVTQIKNYFYDTRKKKEKSEAAMADSNDANPAKKKKAKKGGEKKGVAGESQASQSTTTDADQAGFCMPIDWRGNGENEEEKHMMMQQSLMMQQQNEARFLHEKMLQEEQLQRLLQHQQLERIKEAQMLHEAQQIEDARQMRHQEEQILLQQQMQQQFIYQQMQNQRSQQGGHDWDHRKLFCFCWRFVCLLKKQGLSYTPSFLL
eukprot:scaffold32_cov190-Alexandrium_tamarense.AAC.11